MRLEIEHLCFSYPKKNTIKDISFAADGGDVVAILGINGVGKSTLLKCINYIHKPKSGTIKIDDKDISKMKSKDVAKYIGYVAQYGQFMDGTVFDNILIGRKPYIKLGITQNDLNEVDSVLKSFNLMELSSRNIDKLSGGERQKVSIARSLVQKTPILLFDEPTSNLDLKNQMDILTTIKNIIEENKYIALISIHDINLALRFANKFLLLKEGEVYGFGDESIITTESIKEIYGVESDVEIRNGRKLVIIK